MFYFLAGLLEPAEPETIEIFIWRDISSVQSMVSSYLKGKFLKLFFFVVSNGRTVGTKY